MVDTSDHITVFCRHSIDVVCFNQSSFFVQCLLISIPKSLLCHTFDQKLQLGRDMILYQNKLTVISFVGQLSYTLL
ncbi:hypothetical protein AQUCO_00100598v1 [Aquilegia coerulea]|uniref:Uncharacterized protein n=1 Tax=Aquilegia coerulea TaxID=218851 RepID=A0A2G5FB52_AQUCA|nr:hypothetical protein AQUCO_00100598v1 [Aquilegia coerulea]